MCSRWTLVVDMQHHDEIQPHHATLEMAPSFGATSWHSPVSSFTFQRAGETSLALGLYPAVQNLKQEPST